MKASRAIRMSVLGVLATIGSARAGIVASWDFEEGSGTTVNDGVGSLNGTQTGGTWTTTGDYDGAFGTSLQLVRSEADKVLIPYASQLSGLTSATFETWVKYTGGIPPYQDARIFNMPGADVWYYIDGDPGGSGGLRMTIGGGASGYLFGNPVSLNTWTQVVATYDAGTGDRKLYRNGVLSLTAPGGTGLALSGSDPIGLGNDINGAHNFDGLIDHVSIQDVALTAEQVLARYNLILNNVVTPPKWNIAGSGDWNVDNNWSPSLHPDGIGKEADFFGAISSPQTVYTNIPVTVGTMRFNNANANGRYQIAGQGSLTLEVSSGSALIDVQRGSHKLNLPLFFASNTDITVAEEQALTISNPATIRSNMTVTKNGNVSIEARLTLEAGASFVNQSGALALFGAPSVGADAKVDLKTTSMIVDYGDGQLSPASTIQSQLASAFAGGAWTGSGITTSSSIAGKTGLGWKDDASTDSIQVKYTYYGDTDLSGTVTSTDFNALVAGYGKTTGAIWTDGDFDYDGKVNTLDFNLLAGNFNATPIPAAALGAMVPEPASLSLLFAAAIGLCARHRRI